MSVTSCYNFWKSRMPQDRPFRVSVAMMNGKYKYIHCANVGQFKNWLSKNYNRVSTVVSVK